MSCVHRITIEHETNGAIIYYTTDGTDPDEDSEVYDGEFLVATDITEIRAFATHPAYHDSDIAVDDPLGDCPVFARLTSEYIEILRKGTPSARISNEYIEILRKGTPRARFTSEYIEVLRKI